MAKKKTEKESESFTSWFVHIGTSILFGLLFLFLAMNILFAVSLPNIDPITSGKSEGIVNFMRRARTLSPFQTLFPEIKFTFVNHELEVYKDDHDRRDMIDKLEKALTINPKSRDVLYSLYLLHDKAGNVEKASEYLQRSQEVDPAVK